MKFTIFFLVGLIASASAAAVKSDLEAQLAKGFGDWMLGLLNQVILPPVMESVQTLAELAAQVTAGLAVEGLPALQGLFGKRNAEQHALLVKGFGDWMLGLLNQVILPPVMESVQTLAELAAQVTAGLAVEGLPALQGLFGKRSIDQQKVVSELTAHFQDLFANIVQPALTSSLQTIALMGAQLLAGVAEGGIPALNSILGGLLG